MDKLKEAALDAMGMVGFVSAIYGVSLIHIPAAYIIGGVSTVMSVLLVSKK